MELFKIYILPFWLVSAPFEGALMDNTLLMEDGAVWDLDNEDPVKRIYDNIAPYLNPDSRSASSVRKSVERNAQKK